MEGRLLLDVVVGEGATILKLLASEDQTLLVGRDTLLVLNLGLDVVDGVRRLNLEGNGFASESLNEDLHSTTQTEDQVEGQLLLDVTAEVSMAVSTMSLYHSDAQGVSPRYASFAPLWCMPPVSYDVRSRLVRSMCLGI